jgi:hypothetical protein
MYVLVWIFGMIVVAIIAAAAGMQLASSNAAKRGFFEYGDELYLVQKDKEK